MNCRFWTDKLRVLAPCNRPRNFSNFGQLIEGATAYHINTGMTIKSNKVAYVTLPSRGVPWERPLIVYSIARLIKC